ncbi:MAG: hypothetical protein ACYDBT_08920 [Desulfobulbaceae bacterium]
MKYDIIKEDTAPYFLIRLSGPFDVHDLESCYVEVINNPKWISGTDIIWDAQQCTFDHLSSEDMNVIGYMTIKYKDKRGNGNAAWVVSRDIDFAISRMFWMFNEDKVVFDFRVFRDIETAKKFIIGV